jgi:hypothetical protein
MVKYAAAGLNLKVKRNPIISERHKTAKRKVRRLHVAKIGADVLVDRIQTDKLKLHKTSNNKLLTTQIRTMKYKVAYLRTCLEQKLNSRSHVGISTLGRNGHCEQLQIQ